MTADQRRITLAICVIVGMSLLMSAGLTFLITPMAQALQLDDPMVEDILAIPSVAALIVVFSAGQFGDRFGQRRTLVVASLAFSLGAVLLVFAQSVYPVQIGLAICAASAVTMQIVGVSLLQQATGEGPAHTSAFTTYGIVFPLAFLIFPVATARLLQIANWRLVPIIWIVGGLIMLLVTLLLLRPGPRSAAVGEWFTPLLAGVALAAGARALSEIEDVGPHPGIISASVAVCAVAAVLLVIVRRRLADPSFDIAPVRGDRLPVLLLSVALVSLCGLLTFVSIALEYLYDMTPFEASLAVIPAQVAAILGAKFLARFALRHWDGMKAGRFLMLAIAVTTLPLVLLQVDSSVWLLISIATLFSFVWMAALTVLNAEVMARAPMGSTGAVSAFRTAASSIGAALGVGILGTIVISSVPVDAGEGVIDAAQLVRLTNSLRLDSILASAVAIAGWLVLTVATRRRVPA